MKSAERITVLCSLLLLYTLFSAPVELLSLFWQHSSSTSLSANNNNTATPARPSSPPKPAPKAAPGLTTNYASLFLGASVVSVEPPSCHGGSALISDSVDKYVLCPCAAPRKQFVVQLIRDVEVRAVMLRNAEHFSSGVRNFTLLGSRRYPTATWEVLGSFEAEQRRGRQVFDVTPHNPVRFVKLQWATSHGVEPWCTITSFQVFGLDALETLTRLADEDEEEEENNDNTGEREGGGSAPLAGLAIASPAGVGSVAGQGRGEMLWPPLTEVPMPVRVAAEGAGESGWRPLEPPAATAPLDEVVVSELWEGGREQPEHSPHSSGAAVEAARTTVPLSPSTVSDAPSSGKARSSSASATQADWLPCAGNSSEFVLLHSSGVQCPLVDYVALLQLCALATCDSAKLDVTEAKSEALSVASQAAVQPPAVGSQSSKPTASTAPPSGGSSGTTHAQAKPPYAGAAAPILAQLLRQQKAHHQELAALALREQQVIAELNRTRAFLSDMYLRYRDAARDASEQRDRLRGLSVELQLVHQRLLLREQSDESSHPALWRNETALAVAAFVLSLLAVLVVFVSASSSSQRGVGSPSAWGRQFSLPGTSSVEERRQST